VGLIVNFIDNIINLFEKYWYFWIMGIMGFVIITLWVKYNKNKLPQYYNQIEENKKIKFKELEFNPSLIKKIIYKEKVFNVFGEIVTGYFNVTKAKIQQQIEREYKPEEIKRLELEHIKDEILKTEKPDYIVHQFLVKKKTIFKILAVGSYDVINVFNTDFKRIKTNTIKLNDELWLVYRDGFYWRESMQLIPIVSEQTERLMKDLLINAQGYQQKDFSRIRTDYSHELDIKDKEAQIEKEKKGGRGSIG